MADEKMIDRAEHVLYKTWILVQVLQLWDWDTVMKSIQMQ